MKATSGDELYDSLPILLMIRQMSVSNKAAETQSVSTPVGADNNSE